MTPLRIALAQCRQTADFDLNARTILDFIDRAAAAGAQIVCFPETQTVGYRVEHAGQAVAYVTDTELNDSVFDPTMLALAKDATLLIIDSTYTNEELKQHVGWGHSSWQQTVKFADTAGVKKLCLYHHDPEHDDATMDRIAEASGKARPGTIVAREGMAIEV